MFLPDLHAVCCETAILSRQSRLGIRGSGLGKMCVYPYRGRARLARLRFRDMPHGKGDKSCRFRLSTTNNELGRLQSDQTVAIASPNRNHLTTTTRWGECDLTAIRCGFCPRSSFFACLSRNRHNSSPLACDALRDCEKNSKKICQISHSRPGSG